MMVLLSPSEFGLFLVFFHCCPIKNPVNTVDFGG
jgi:hypothetical protein